MPAKLITVAHRQIEEVHFITASFRLDFPGVLAVFFTLIGHDHTVCQSTGHRDPEQQTSLHVARGDESTHIRVFGCGESSVRSLSPSKAKLYTLGVWPADQIHSRSIRGNERRKIDQVEDGSLNQLEQSERPLNPQKWLVCKHDHTSAHACDTEALRREVLKPFEKIVRHVGQLLLEIRDVNLCYLEVLKELNYFVKAPKYREATFERRLSKKGFENTRQVLAFGFEFGVGHRDLVQVGEQRCHVITRDAVGIEL